MPPSTSRAGAFAWTIGPSQARHAYLGRIVRKRCDRPRALRLGYEPRLKREGIQN
jgi:hypothetical protein